MKLKSLFVNWKKSLVLFIVGIIISLVFLIKEGFDVLINYCDAFFVAGFVIAALGVLSVLSYFGAFDTISYSFYALGRVFTREKDMKEKEYQDLVDYVEKKKDKRKNLKIIFFPYIYNGIIFILTSIILLIFV